MANKSKVQSVEPDIADLVNGWLKSYGLDYKLEQASLNSERVSCQVNLLEFLHYLVLQQEYKIKD